jgi:ribosomal protein S1
MKVRILILLACLGLAATAALAHGGEEHVMGTVTKVTDKSITVKTTAKEPVTVAIAPATKFIRDKAPAKVTDLSVGDRVVIHAVENANEKLVADTVEFAPTKKPAQAAGPQKKPA